MAIPKEGSYGFDRMSGVVDANGLLTLYHRTPDTNEHIIYDAVVIENETSNGSEFRLGVKTPNNFYLRQCYKAINSDTPQVYDNSPIFVGNDNRLEIRITGGTQNDIVVVYVWYRIKPIKTDN